MDKIHKSLSDKQRGVQRGALCALGLTLVNFWLGSTGRLFEIPSSATVDISTRLLFALRYLSLLPFCLFAAIGGVGNHRYASEKDIDAGLSTHAPSHELKMKQAILQNTLEQIVSAFIAHLCLAAALPAWQLGLIPALCCQFILGRVCFWWGYERGAGGRAFGFGCTFCPTVLATLYCLYLNFSPF